MTPDDPLMNLSASDHCDLIRRQVLALGTLVPTAVALLGGCSLTSGAQLTSKVTHGKISLSDVAPQMAKAATACDQLGNKLLVHHPRKDSATTTLASPSDLAFVLAILINDATSAATQDYDVLLGLLGEDHDRARSTIQNPLNHYDSDLRGFDPGRAPGKPLVHLTSHVLTSDNKEFKVKQTYLDTALRWFSTEIEQVGVSSMKEDLGARTSCSTAGLILESGIDVTQDTHLAMQNVLLFVAQWESPFETGSTSQRNFALAGGKTVKTDLMHNTRSIPHAAGEGWAAVRLAYADGQDERGSDLALDVVLPGAGTLLSAMDTGAWAETSTALDRVRPREVEPALPKLDLTSEPKELLGFLREQGLKPKGLDKITPELALAQVTQQMRLILDGEGTVAVALSKDQAAAVATPAEQTKPITFTVDHPYMLRLRSLTSNTALLKAAIMDPTVKEISGSA